MAYGHLTETRPRQCVFAGTINYEQYLKDETGNRRYWPIATNGEANLEWLREWRDQLWAEANEAEKTLSLTDEALELPRELWPVAAAEQEKRMVEDSWMETLRDCLMPNEGQGARYHSADIFRYVLGLNPTKEYEPGRRLKRNMINLGFRHSTELRINKVKRNGYYWPADENDSPSAEPRPDTKVLQLSPWSVTTGEHTPDGSRGGNGSGDDDTPF